MAPNIRHQRPDLGLAALEERVSYAQCWEDHRLLSEALAVGPEDDVLSICSAGDNAFALAIDGARSVTCLDLSGPQLALAELKLVAARSLPLSGFRSLLGLDDFGRRVWFYHQIRDALGPRARSWWDAHEVHIRLGLLGSGRFERYLETFRTRVLPVVHRRRTIEDFFDQPDLAAQRAFFAERWDSRRWRGLFRLFFSERLMAAMGRSPAHFRYVEGPVGEAFLRRAERVLTELPLDDNPYVQWMLRGRFADPERTHPYLSATGHAALGAAAEGLRFVEQDLEGFLEQCEPGSFSAFNYSNVFEYLSEAQHRRILELTARAARPGARIAYWNLLVPRSRPPELAGLIEVHPERSAALLARDRAFVYGAFHLETVK